MSGGCLDLDRAVKRLPSLYCRVKELEKLIAEGGEAEVGAKIKYTVENYTVLLTIIDQ